ncbi:hypothetical protein PR048_017004 [Dryococelus australis]|uniref:Uncharacterized protein n=1 Tax=Dryococelus australis TaxID=614101 RepID=A0ABQ9H8A0_9NEOP|nr:hypothetical protein PR048_017004 [Dryococelus australis]
MSGKQPDGGATSLFWLQDGTLACSTRHAVFRPTDRLQTPAHPHGISLLGLQTLDHIDHAAASNPPQFGFRRRCEYTIEEIPGSIPGGVASGFSPLVGGFSRGSPVSTPLHSDAAPYPPRFALIGSQELNRDEGAGETRKRAGIFWEEVRRARGALKLSLPYSRRRRRRERPRSLALRDPGEQSAPSSRRSNLHTLDRRPAVDTPLTTSNAWEKITYFPPNVTARGWAETLSGVFPEMSAVRSIYYSWQAGYRPFTVPYWLAPPGWQVGYQVLIGKQLPDVLLFDDDISLACTWSAVIVSLAELTKSSELTVNALQRRLSLSSPAPDGSPTSYVPIARSCVSAREDDPCSSGGQALILGGLLEKKTGQERGVLDGVPRPPLSELSTRQDNEAASECKVGGNGSTPRKSARQRPPRFKTREKSVVTSPGIEPGLPPREVSSLTSTPPRPRH